MKASLRIDDSDFEFPDKDKLGCGEIHVLIEISGSRPSLESSLTRKPPHPKRKARWIQLNEILEENTKKLKTSDSTAYSYVSWNQVESILQTESYVQSSKKIPDVQFNILSIFANDYQTPSWNCPHYYLRVLPLQWRSSD